MLTEPSSSTGALLDIDGGGGPWTAELTHGLMNQFSLGVLWDEWGIDGTIVISV